MDPTRRRFLQLLGLGAATAAVKALPLGQAPIPRLSLPRSLLRMH